MRVFTVLSFLFAAPILAFAEAPVSDGGPFCPSIARICKDGSPAVTVPGTCQQVCPNDKPEPRQCPAIALVCPKGQKAVYLDPNSCTQTCVAKEKPVVGSEPSPGAVGKGIPGKKLGRPGVPTSRSAR